MLHTLAGQASRGGWNPLQLANLAGWWDASRLSSITSTGSLVDQLDDLSGNGRHFTSSGADRPDTGTSARNGHNVIVFDNDEFLSQPSFDPSRTNFAVFGVASCTQGSGNRVWFSFGTNDHVGMTFHAAAGGGTGVLFGGIAWIQDGVSRADGTWHQQSYVHESATSGYGRIDGTRNITTTAQPSQAPTSQDMWIGGDQAGQLIDMQFAEVFVVSGSTPTASEVRAAEAYLRGKWGTP